MSLKDYSKKRNFKLTPEPPEKQEESPEERATKKPVFVMHKHYATHLHYDFRLELDGVLKSWAIPKGPSLNPVEKRLAVMVEDHPFNYKDFEGTIPEGSYGAGKVIIWDSGYYHALGTSEREKSMQIIRDELRKGHITFILEGKKLKGEFALIRLKKGDPKNWLLIKKKDEFASEKEITAEDPPNNLNDKKKPKNDIKNNSKDIKKLALEVSRLKGVKKTNAIPHPSPMLATLTDKPFDSSDWIFEIKWDGYRTIAQKNKKGVELYSRNDKSFNKQFAPIAKSLEIIPYSWVFDGETVVVDSSGRSNFQLLQQYLKNNKGALVYYIFDLLYFEGYSLFKVPLLSRKELLTKIISELPYIKVSEHIENNGIDFFNVAVKNGLEGIMAKKKESLYFPGERRKEWLKIKSRQSQEVIIAGYTEPEGSREKIGSLVTGVYEKGNLVFTGLVGGGLDELEIDELKTKLDRIRQEKSAFKIAPKLRRHVTWTKPELVAQVEFEEWTDENLMRQPVFMGLREDKPAKAVIREKPKPSIVD